MGIRGDFSGYESGHQGHLATLIVSKDTKHEQTHSKFKPGGKCGHATASFDCVASYPKTKNSVERKLASFTKKSSESPSHKGGG